MVFHAFWLLTVQPHQLGIIMIESTLQVWLPTVVQVYCLYACDETVCPATPTSDLQVYLARFWVQGHLAQSICPSQPHLRLPCLPKLSQLPELHNARAGSKVNPRHTGASYDEACRNDVRPGGIQLDRSSPIPLRSIIIKICMRVSHVLDLSCCVRLTIWWALHKSRDSGFKK